MEIKEHVANYFIIEDRAGRPLHVTSSMSAALDYVDTDPDAHQLKGIQATSHVQAMKIWSDLHE